MNYNKIRKFCRKFRIAIGLGLIGVGIYTGIVWFYLGIIPLIAGLADFCPICMITKKCDLPEAK
ncbi:DUF2892 domain-containing protein [Sulfurovum sp. zt1-1]|uniref:DUF2892 domain-containing protein n=1 Tax=Sulfurovum zhangzhouensis TaxID=3019067 RepID=A0ABT7QV01_9BACT|nr:YgaP-like transmembrane domain [Sulfurovum zhangzhouensis]MDM5270675.1 DUF2892 domain-containing protein [Sulfurovum zhangzhouensis]